MYSNSNDSYYFTKLIMNLCHLEGDQHPPSFTLTNSQLFPLQYHIVDQSPSCESYLREVLLYIQHIQKHHHILIKSQLQALKDGYKNIGRYSHIFYQEFGAVVVLRRKQPFMKTSMSLLFLKQTDVKAITCGSKSYFITDEASSFGQFALGEISFGASFEQQKQLLEKAVKMLIQSNQTILNVHKSPDLLKQILLKAKANNCSQFYKNNQNILVINESGTYNMTQIKFTRISHFLSACLLTHIYKDTNLVTFLLFSFRLNSLASSLQSYNPIKSKFPSQLQIFNNCLVDLISQYKQLYNKDIKIDPELFKIQIGKIHNKVEELIGFYGQGHSPKITQDQLRQSIEKQLKQNKVQNVNQILKHINFANTNVVHSNNIGFVDSLVTMSATPFTNLNKSYSYLLSKQNGEYKWILMVEQYFFRLALQLANTQNLQGLDINEISTNPDSTQNNIFSALHLVVNNYEKIMTANISGSYGMKLSNQVISHVYLIKYIAAAISFERAKLNSQLYLNKYRLDLDDVLVLYNQFTSLCFNARAAMQIMVQYTLFNVNKPTLFSLAKGKDSYKEYACHYFDNDANMKERRQELHQQLQTLKEQLQDSFNILKKKWEQLNLKITINGRKLCECIFQMKPNIYNYSQPLKVKTLECLKCKEDAVLNKQLQKIKSQSFQYIKSPLPIDEEDIKIQIFFQSQIPVITGLMKIIYESQIVIKSKKQYFINSNKLPSFKPLHPFAPFLANVALNKFTNMDKSSSQFINYTAPLIIHYYSYTTKQLLQKQMLAPQKIINLHQWIVNRTNKTDFIREHQIYTVQDYKQFKMSYQQFVETASVRVGQRTQLPILCQGMLNRKLSSDITKDYQISKLMILNTIGEIFAFKRLEVINQQWIYQNQQSLFVRECMEDLLVNFVNQWRFQDLNWLQISGVVFSLGGKLIKKSYLTTGIVKKAFDQFSRYKKQTEEDSSNLVKLRQLFTLHSILSCYSEDICAEDGEACLIFAKIMINFRLNKRILVNNAKQQLSEIINEFRQYFIRAVFKNINSAVNYFKYNPQLLTQVIRQVDLDISLQTKWQFMANQNYVFRGLSKGNQYLFNLYEGICLKNRAESSCLPERFKLNNEYIAIFGRFTDLQVFQMSDKQLRTRIDFAKYFSNQQDKRYKQKGGQKDVNGKLSKQLKELKQSDVQIFFQFCFKQSEQMVPGIAIKQIIKRGNQQQSYLLLSQQILQKCQLYIPELYLKQYYCWCEKSTFNLIFRRRSLYAMSQVGLVFISEYRPKLNSLIIKQGRVITKQFQNQPLYYLTKPEHSVYFQKLFIVNKQQRLNQAIKILSSIQLPQFIIQLNSSSATMHCQFWLHRSNTKFIFNKKYGLTSLSYQGYAVAEEYSHYYLLPWRHGQASPCLMLRKYSHNYKMTQMHQYMFLTPEQQIKSSSNLIIDATTSSLQKLYVYQIHDNFLQIRSKSRATQLHLACLIASVTNQYCFKELMMTHQEYCIDLVRSCYSNLPLDYVQAKKLKNLLQLSMQHNMNMLTLVCSVLLQMTNSMHQVLSFKNYYFHLQTINSFFKMNQNLFQACKFIYQSRCKAGNLSIHLKLTELQLNLLGLDPDLILQYQNSASKSYWNKKEAFNIQINDKILHSLNTGTNSYRNILKDVEHIEKSIFKYFQEVKGNQFTKDAQKILSIELMDKMSQEMLQQLKESYQAFIRYNTKYQNLELTKEDVIQMLKKFFITPRTKCQKYRQTLAKTLNKINIANKDHIDVMQGVKTLISQNHYTDILCHEGRLYQFCPNISKKSYDALKSAIREWIELTLEIQSLDRFLLILDDTPIDKIALFRELQSPRKQILQKTHWLCFQAQMKIRIWLSQYNTYKYLIGSKSGSVSQLNMGQGKTQVIIPLIVLDNIYERVQRGYICRINILAANFEQTQSNYFRFFSVTSFRIPCFSFYFNRDCRVHEGNVNAIKRMVYLMKDKLLMLMDRESCLSMILKEREEILVDLTRKMGKKRDDWLFEDYPMFDIFDEVDALMTAKKSFVYSIGKAQPLQQNKIRNEIARVLIQIICRQMLQWLDEQKILILQQSFKSAELAIMRGSYPKGMRLSSDLSRDKLLKFRVKLAGIFLESEKYKLNQFKFYDNLDVKNKAIILKYLTDQNQSQKCIECIGDKLPIDKHQILATRGFLAAGILQHSLTLRNGVDFGVPGVHPKRLCVPYDFADVPSKRSQYSQPDIAIVLSNIGYFNKGLRQQQFQQVILNLNEKALSVKQKYYKQWTDAIQLQEFQPLLVMKAKQINMTSEAQQKYLFQKFRYCRATINYWLVFCVFQGDLMQYKSSITSSSWDIAYVEKSIGFSGTKDTRWLNPTNITTESSQNDSIKGTDGKMMFLMLNHTKKILPIKYSNDYLWMRFCDNVLELGKEGVGCIIDAGAILAGKSLEKQIVVEIGRKLDKQKFRGITFCDENGKWKVYDIVTLSVVDRGTSIPQEQTFVIFDEARTRGADIKMKSNMKAVLSLSSNMTKDKLMQAVGRMRKFGRCQQLYIMGTEQILAKIKGIDHHDKVQQIRSLINWACQNSLKQNRQYLYPNSQLALIHYRTVLLNYPDVVKTDTSLMMYAGRIKQQTVFNLFAIRIAKENKQVHSSRQVDILMEKMKAYGNKYCIQAGNFDDVCEREVDAMRQKDENKENQHAVSSAIEETDQIKVYEGNVSTLSITFDANLQFTCNFIQCTRSFISFLNFDVNNNVLCNVNFVLIRSNKLTIISQRQANNLIGRGIMCLGPISLQQQTGNREFIARFQDLTLTNPVIVQRKLEAALVHSQYFNGRQNYDLVSRQILFNLIKQKYSSILKCKANPQLILNNQLIQQNLRTNFSLQQIASFFLAERLTSNDKFISSDLEKIMVQVQFIPLKDLIQ